MRPTGGMTFPMNGVSLHWFGKLWSGGGIVDIKSAFVRSLKLGLLVMTLTVVLSTLAGLAFRKKFFGQNMLFYVTVASLIVPSIVTSLGIALQFRLLDDAIKAFAPAFIADDWTTGMGLYSSALGAHLTWTLPFGLLITFAIFNRFDSRFEEAARNNEAPVLLTSPLARPFVRSIVERFRPQTSVLSQSEIHPRVRLKTVGNV